jgi:hypothetical protein
MAATRRSFLRFLFGAAAAAPVLPAIGKTLAETIAAAPEPLVGIDLAAGPDVTVIGVGWNAMEVQNRYNDFCEEMRRQIASSFYVDERYLSDRYLAFGRTAYWRQRCKS